MDTVAQQEQINGLGRDSKRITVGVIITTEKEREEKRERDTGTLCVSAMHACVSRMTVRDDF